MKNITLIFIGFFLFTAFLNAQNTNAKTYFDDHFVGGLAVDGDIIWVGVDNTLVKMDKSTGETIVSYTIPMSYTYPDPNRYASSISLDSNGLVWIKCQGNIPYLETFSGGEIWTEIPIPTPWFSGLVIDKNDKIWVSTILGLHKYDGTGWIDYNSSNTGLPYSAVTSLAVDSQNNKWFGLSFDGINGGEGLVKFDDIQFTLFSSSYLNNFYGTIWSIDVSPSGTVWIGTYENGLVKFDGLNWEVYNSANSGLPPDAVWNVSVDGTNIIWLSTLSGLTRFDGENWNTFNTDNSILPSNTINSILVDENGTKWVGTNKGLISFIGNALNASDKQYSGVKINLFPNPANDFITLKMPLDVVGSTVEVFNIQGNVIKPIRMTNNNYKMNIEDLASGMYFIRLQTANGIAIKKFVKQN